MLSYNAYAQSQAAVSSDAPAPVPAASGCASCAQVTSSQSGAGAERHAHVAHMAVVGLHTVCCGLPIAAGTLVALAGVGAGGVVLLADGLHDLLHSYEVWVLAGSGLLLAAGILLEGVARRGRLKRGIPWLLIGSAAAFLVNAAFFVSHQGGYSSPPPVLEASLSPGPAVAAATTAPVPSPAADHSDHGHQH